jgi:hypothetical protein
LILCQITSRAHYDAFAVPLDGTDFEHGQFAHQCFIRPQRLFTVDCRVILKSVGKVQAAKLDEVLVKVRELSINAAKSRKTNVKCLDTTRFFHLN